MPRKRSPAKYYLLDYLDSCRRLAASARETADIVKRVMDEQRIQFLSPDFYRHLVAQLTVCSDALHDTFSYHSESKHRILAMRAREFLRRAPRLDYRDVFKRRFVETADETE